MNIENCILFNEKLMPKTVNNAKVTIKKANSILAPLESLFLSELDEDDGETDFTDEFEAQDMQAHFQSQLQDTVLTLADYLSAVQLVINETFAHSVWVKAEIRSLSSKSGHYYFELADKDEAGKITASCRGNLWKSSAKSVIDKFEKTTGMTLERGLNVLLKVSATFHAQYGFSLNISDIDPTFTIGDLAQQYQAMLARLAEENLLDLNKSIPAPFDIQHVVVIAPENAAGLGDFRADADNLEQHKACYFHYQTATFQGNHAPSEIRHAISQGLKKFKAAYQKMPDLLVIIRGGGAVGDLAYLNDYELAALVAEQPIPVWVGIGHERDRVILDEVAQRSFDTPSKVIAGIVNQLRLITETAQQTFLQIEQLALNQVAQVEKQATQNMQTVKDVAQNRLNFYRQQCDMTLEQIKNLSYQQVKTAQIYAEQYRDMILLQHPSRVLAQGYAIVRGSTDKNNPTGNGNGKIFTQVQDLRKDQVLTLEMQDGKVAVKVISILPNE